MRTIIACVLVLTMLLAASCSKNNSGYPSSSNSWTFKGTTYTTHVCADVGSMQFGSELFDTSTTGSYGSQIMINFTPAVYPVTSGTYTVVSSNYGSGNQFTTGKQIEINMFAGSSVIYNNNPYFSSTGGNGTNQTVQVTVSSGKISVNGTGIEMINTGNPSDSSALNINITQTQ